MKPCPKRILFSRVVSLFFSSFCGCFLLFMLILPDQGIRLVRRFFFFFSGPYLRVERVCFPSRRASRGFPVHTTPRWFIVMQRLSACAGGFVSGFFFGGVCLRGGSALPVSPTFGLFSWPLMNPPPFPPKPANPAFSSASAIEMLTTRISEPPFSGTLFKATTCASVEPPFTRSIAFGSSHVDLFFFTWPPLLF